MQSIYVGLETLRNPHVLLLILALLLLHTAYLFTLQLATKARESQDAAAPGCLTQVVGILFQGFLMGLFVLLLLPILLGINSRLSWTMVESFVLLATRAGIIAVLTVMVLSYLPLLGRFLSASPGLEAFLTGTIIFRLSSPLFIEKAYGIKPSLGIFPSFWAYLGYLTIAILLTKIIMVAITFIRRANGSTLFGPSLDLLGGVLPLLMLASYAKLSLSP